MPSYRLRYRKGHFWSPGKFVRTVGSVDLETTNRYVAQQRTYTQTALSDYANGQAKPTFSARRFTNIGRVGSITYITKKQR